MKPEPVETLRRVLIRAFVAWVFATTFLTWVSMLSWKYVKGGP